MNNKSRTLLISGVIIIALTAFIAMLTDTLTTSHVYWMLGAESIATVLTMFSLNSKSGMKFSVLPLMSVYVFGALLYSIILLSLGKDSEKILHIGQVTFLAITAIAYLVMKTTYGKKDIKNY